MSKHWNWLPVKSSQSNAELCVLHPSPLPLQADYLLTGHFSLTRSMQIVHADKHTKMLDSPSIIPDPSNSALALALRSIIDSEESSLAHMFEGVDAILNNCSKQKVSSIFFRISHLIWLPYRFLRPTTNIGFTSNNSGGFCTAFPIPHRVSDTSKCDLSGISHPYKQKADPVSQGLFSQKRLWVLRSPAPKISSQYCRVKNEDTLTASYHHSEDLRSNSDFTLVSSRLT